MCTLFLADDITDELYARIITNDNRVWEIAMPATLGLVGAAFTTRQTVNVPSAYNDPRFYRGIDDQLGINSGSQPLTSGRGGFGMSVKDVTRRAYFDHLELFRQV